MDICIDELTYRDYHNGFLQLLEQLTIVGEIDEKAFELRLCAMKSSGIHTFVLRESGNLIVIGTGSILIEKKFIHGLSSVGHIEDIVIDKKYRGYGLGKMLIDHLINIGKKNNCYKIILNCDEKNEGFYNKCNFNRSGLEMRINVV